MGKIVQNFIDNSQAKIGKNQEVVEILREEMKQYRPSDAIVFGRGCGKTMHRNYTLLCYFVYAAYCDWLEDYDIKVPIEIARQQIADCIEKCWDALFQE